MKRRALAGVVMAVALAVGTGAQAKEWTKIRWGVEGAYPPFSEVGTDGHIKGFDIDIANALCEHMKAQCTLVQQDWDGMIPALKARKFDAIIASMSMTEERRKQIDFTRKYYNTPARFVVKKGGGVEVSEAGLKGKKIGVQRATIHDRYATDVYGNVAEVVRYATQDEAYLDIVNGSLDALLADSVALKTGFLEREGKTFEFAGPPLTDRKWFGDGAGIAIRQGDTDLSDQINAAIDAIRADGTWKRISDKYFDFDIWGAPAS